MRLIDADALSDAMYRKSFETDDGRQKWDGGLWIRYKVFEETRDEAPTIDAVPVVRCRDCRYFAGEFMYCALNIIVPFDYFFCLNGRREADDEAD